MRFQYLGNYTSEKVKKKCIEFLYSWSVSLSHEPKISEAYQMMKRQGIVKEDPIITSVVSADSRLIETLLDKVLTFLNPEFNNPNALQSVLFRDILI